MGKICYQCKIQFVLSQYFASWHAKLGEKTMLLSCNLFFTINQKSLRCNLSWTNGQIHIIKGFILMAARRKKFFVTVLRNHEQGNEFLRRVWAKTNSFKFLLCMRSCCKSSTNYKGRKLSSISEDPLVSFKELEKVNKLCKERSFWPQRRDTMELVCDVSGIKDHLREPL